jgi:hypothetical protein
MLSTANTAQMFLKRFYAFADSVLRRFEIALDAETSQSKIIATIAARDAVAERWVNVRLVLSNVIELCINEAATPALSVLSNGLQIGQFDEIYYFVFDPYTLEPESREEYTQSEFYVSAREFRWTVEPYTEASGEGEAKEYFPLSLLATRIYLVLLERAKCSQCVITYKELAATLADLSFPFDKLKAHDQRLNTALAEITAACQFHSLPALSAIVVSAATGLPGNGYLAGVRAGGAPITRAEWEDTIQRIRRTAYPPVI